MKATSRRKFPVGEGFCHSQWAVEAAVGTKTVVARGALPAQLEAGAVGIGRGGEGDGRRQHGGDDEPARGLCC